VVDGIACARLKSSPTAVNGVKVMPQAKRYILKLLTTQRLGLFLFIRNGDDFAQNIARFCPQVS